jgi:glyoxylase-like metal-dependent hydrolase (beta-lactamase superfamily II)
MALGAFLDSPELVAPVAFESGRPFVERPDPLGVRAIENLAAVTPHLHQADVTKHAEVLGDRRLRKAQRYNDVADGTLAGCEIVQDVSTTRFGDGVERVRRRGSARHRTMIFLYWNMSSGSIVHITHGHGDHWFGVGTLLERFPDAKAVATPNAVRVMRRNASPEALEGIWKPAFPDQIPDRLVIAEELEGNVIDLEGHELVAVELGHTDTDFTSCLHVPSIGLVVAGDAAYNDVHLYLAESNAQTRREWIAALDTIESLNPRAVVASHKRPENDDNPAIIEQTRQYIRDFDRLAVTTTSAQDLYEKMLELYPNRVNPGWALWSSARAVTR